MVPFIRAGATWGPEHWPRSADDCKEEHDRLCKHVPPLSMVIQTERLLLFLFCLLWQTQFCWHTQIAMKFATFTVKRHQILNETSKFTGIPHGWWMEALTEQGLQADHTGHEAIKVNGQLAAGVADDNAMLHLIVEHETWRHRKHMNHWHSRLICCLWCDWSMGCCSCRQTWVKDRTPSLQIFAELHHLPLLWVLSKAHCAGWREA